MNRRIASLVVAVLLGAGLSDKAFANCAKILSFLRSPAVSDAVVEKLARMRDDRIAREQELAVTRPLVFHGRSVPIVRSLDYRNHVFLVTWEGKPAVYKAFYNLAPQYSEHAANYRVGALDEMDSEAKAMRALNRIPTVHASEVLEVDKDEIALLKRYVNGVSFLQISVDGAKYELTPNELVYFLKLYRKISRRAELFSRECVRSCAINLFFDLDLLKPVFIDPI